MLNNDDIKTAYVSGLHWFAFSSSVIVCLTIFGLYRTVQEVQSSQELAQRISSVSIAMNLIWNLFYFAINFKFAIQGQSECMQFLGIPAFCFFFLCFTYETRLFGIVWCAQLEHVHRIDDEFMR